VNPLQDKRIVLGVSGSVAAYKAAELASKLTQAKAQVDVVLSEGAERFISPLTFASLTGRKAYSSLWDSDAHVVHVGLGEAADLLVIAPCSANTLAKLATGQADNLLTLTALAARCPVLVAPAMDGGMFEHPATQANIQTLRQRGVQVLGPAQGRMASGLLGWGRMLEPAEILGQLRLVLSRGGPLAGRHVLVSAGGTQEPLDPVRYLTNRSSGKQGFALAQAALDLGAQVSLVAGATAASLPTPYGAERIDVDTAAQMAEAILQRAGSADVLIMAAAVADFRPRQVQPHKIKKNLLPQVELEPTPDILLAVAEQRRQTGRPAVVVGFAAESQNLLENAQDKLARKGLSMVVANPVGLPDAGFAVDTNRVSLLWPGGAVEHLPLLSKSEVAEEVLKRVVALLAEG